MNAEVAEIYGNNESFIGEIVKKEEIHTSFAVSHQTAKVTAAVQKMELQYDQESHSWAYTQFSPVTQSCPSLCNPMNRSTPGLPVHHQLPEST